MHEYTTWINLESKDFSTSAQHSHLKKKENPSDYSTDTHGDISTNSFHTYSFFIANISYHGVWDVFRIF